MWGWRVITTSGAESAFPELLNAAHVQNSFNVVCTSALAMFTAKEHDGGPGMLLPVPPIIHGGALVLGAAGFKLAGTASAVPAPLPPL